MRASARRFPITYGRPLNRTGWRDPRVCVFGGAARPNGQRSYAGQCMGLSWPAVEAALTTDPHRLPPALLADVQRHLEGLVFRPASQQPLNLSWSPPRFECETPRPAGQPPRRIIDVVPFSYELDVLELRLHELNATVDLFVVVEAPITHRGKP